MGLFSSDDEDDETAKPDAAPAAAEPKQMSNDDMIAAALISLAPGLVGGMMGGKRGALAGVGAGTKAAADMAGHMAKKNDEDEAIVKKSAADSLNRKNDLLDFEEKEKIKNKLNPKDAKTAETKTVGKNLMERQPDGSWKAVFTAPSGGEDGDGVSGKEGRSAAMQARGQFTREARPFQVAINSAKETEKLAGMAKTNPRAAGALISKLARSAGEVGVLSDSDIARLGGEESFKARLERFALLSTSPQKITDEDIASAQELAQNMQASASANLNALAASQVDSFHSIYGGDKGLIYKQITGADPAKAETETTKTNLKVPLSPEYVEALNWAKDPKNIKDPHWTAVVEKLKAAGVVKPDDAVAGK